MYIIFLFKVFSFPFVLEFIGHLPARKTGKRHQIKLSKDMLIVAYVIWIYIANDQKQQSKIHSCFFSRLSGTICSAEIDRLPTARYNVLQSTFPYLSIYIFIDRKIASMGRGGGKERWGERLLLPDPNL